MAVLACMHVSHGTTGMGSVTTVAILGMYISYSAGTVSLSKSHMCILTSFLFNQQQQASQTLTTPKQFKLGSFM